LLPVSGQAVVFRPAIWTTVRLFHHQQAAARALVCRLSSDCRRRIDRANGSLGTDARFFPPAASISDLGENLPAPVAVDPGASGAIANITQLAFADGAEAALDIECFANG
jgi:hypothetical protein